MVTRNRTFVRTPRRRKLFIQYNNQIGLGVGATTPEIDDMLDQGFTDLGMSNMGGLTVMDVRGKLALEQSVASPAVSSAAQTIRCGYNWFDPGIATAPDGDSQIPEPLQLGVRETKWIQQWEVTAVEPPVGAPVIVGAPLSPIESSRIDGIHVRNMRRQPSADSRLCFVISGGSGYEAGTVKLTVALLIMLALP